MQSFRISYVHINHTDLEEELDAMRRSFPVQHRDWGLKVSNQFPSLSKGWT